MSGTESVRAKIALQIKTDNPDFIVKAFGANAPDNLGKGKVFVTVFRESLEQGSNSLTHNIKIHVMVGTTDGSGEDFNDEALDQCLLSLVRIDGVIFRSAERAMFDEKYIGHQITAECMSYDVYTQIISEERSNN